MQAAKNVYFRVKGFTFRVNPKNELEVLDSDSLGLGGSSVWKKLAIVGAVAGAGYLAYQGYQNYQQSGSVFGSPSKTVVNYLPGSSSAPLNTSSFDWGKAVDVAGNVAASIVNAKTASTQSKILSQQMKMANNGQMQLPYYDRNESYNPMAINPDTYYSAAGSSSSPLPMIKNKSDQQSGFFINTQMMVILGLAGVGALLVFSNGRR